MGAAIVLFALFFWLGRYVSTHPEPHALLVFAHAVRGHAIGAALFFTAAGREYVLGPLYALLLLVAIVSSRWRVPALLAVASGLACWGLADAFQHYFARPRRHDWLVVHETAFSYPSSHVATSTGFYFLCGLLLLRSNLERWIRIASFVVLTLLALAISWSRLALGAHYPTDVIGGALLGAAVLCAAAAVLSIVRRARARAL